jgi:flagellar hook-basal body complex protein FliE
VNPVQGIEFIGAERMPSIDPIGMPNGFGATDVAQSAGDFAPFLAQAIQGVNGKLIGADKSLQGLASGADTNLHHVMMKLEDAKLSLQFALQVRNRLLEAYSEVTRMQL